MLSSRGNTPTPTFNLKVVAIITSLHSYAQNHLIGVFHRLTGNRCRYHDGHDESFMSTDEEKTHHFVKKDWGKSAIIRQELILGAFSYFCISGFR